VVGARRLPRAAWGVSLGVAYLVPALFRLVLDRYLPAYQFVWIALVLGVVIGAAPLTRWSLPDRWRLPLAYWAAAVAATWPIVVWREADFRWAMLDVYHNATTGLGGPPPVVAVTLIATAVTTLAGILLFDACFAAFDPADRRRVERWVIAPLFVSALVNAALAVYQGTVDIAFLNAHNWPIEHRAGGGLVDANASGAVAGFWCCLAVAFAGAWTKPRLAAVATAAALLGAGLWMTGSRSALLAGVIVVAATAFAAARLLRARRMLVAVAFAAIAIAGVALAMSGSSNAVSRMITQWKEGVNRASASDIIKEQLFNRGAPVGTMSVQMMEEYPWTGVGVGAFHQLMSDYGFVITGLRLPPDNAQSWYRHELAELGLIGSVGWVWWGSALVWLVLRSRRDGTDRFAAAVIAAALLSIAVVSLVAGPMHVIQLSLTFWLLVFWYLAASDSARARLLAPARAITATPWAAAAVAVLLFAAGTAWVGWTKLRPPYRALWADWVYWRGAYDPESGPDGTFWWTSQESAIVKPAQPGYAKVSVWVSHPDVTSRPVTVQLWRQHHEPIYSAQFADASRHDLYIAVPTGARNLMLETWVSRTWSPGGAGDRRELGLGMSDWSFVSAPPEGAVVLR
jgi:hypothetical protein